MIKKIIILMVGVIVIMQAKTYKTDHTSVEAEAASSNHAWSDKYTNELINEDSPYLLQHAHNPVHWHAWNKKAFELAKKENKLIFLSIGYSTCHWCHVMERESFEDEEVAKVLNDNYIAIKVDREEMPSVDKHFQDVFYVINQRGGGWPLTIILTPDGKPFFSATYLPKESKYGRPGLLEMLKYFAKLKNKNYKKIVDASKDVDKYLQIYEERKNSSNFKALESKDLAEKFVKGVLKNYDNENFGIGVAPKFPHASTIKALLIVYQLNGNKQALKMADEMLTAMSKGGIYDQIESGFFRYSTDERWMIPHFEKMLYTNAELLEDYALAYEITKNESYKNVVNDLGDFIQKRFGYKGLFFSASDADSFDKKSGKKEEGAYFVYTYSEAKKALDEEGVKNSKDILEYFSITEDGNFEGKNNPYIEEDVKKPDNLKKAKEILLKLREERAYPFVDQKILTSWNALTIKAFLKAGKIEKRFMKVATESLDKLIDELYVDGELYHQKLPGKKVKVKANLEDYSFVISALIDAYENSFDKSYLKLANKLLKKAIEEFYVDGSWYSSIEPFKVKASFEGNAYVSSLGIMVENLEKLALIEEDLSYHDLSNQTLNKSLPIITRYPANFPQAVIDKVAFDKGYIILKAKKDALLPAKNMLENFYPFILYKVVQTKEYLACKVDVCFAYSKDLNEIVSKIKKEVGN